MAARLRIVILLLIIIGGSTAAWFYWQNIHPGAGRSALTLYGNIDLRQVNLAFNDAARITQIKVQTGDKVQPGEIIATLDPRRYEAALAAAKAQLAANQAVLEKLIHGSRPEDIDRLRALVAADQANLTEKQLTFNRIQHLAEQKMAAPQDRDTARAARDATAAQLKADQASLKLAVIGSRVEDIDQARAAVDAAKAQVQNAQINRDDAVLKAPAIGIVRNRILEPGDMASPARPVIALALTDPIWARVYVDESDLGLIREGLPATLTSDSFPGKTFTGWVGYVSPSAEFTPKTVETTTVRTDLVYQARIYACNPNNQLRLGMPVSVHIARDAKPRPRGENPCSPQNSAGQ
ncbi:MAG: efflux RND transporter periplasmic adaptor subunit [Halothiobacillus sp.]